MQGKWIKPVLAVIAVPVVTIGAYQMVRAYEAGTAFQPNGSGRELQANQVIFSGEEDTSAQKNGEEQNGESELWEKDKTAEDSLSPELKNSANYLFQNGRRNLPDNGNGETINLAGEEAGNNSFLPEDGNRQPDTGNNYVYDVTGDTDNADLVITGGNGQNAGNGSTDGINGSGNGSGNGNGNNGQGSYGGNDADRPGQAEPSQTPSPEPQPTTRPADTVKDPEIQKDLPNIGMSNVPYDESDIPENYTVFIMVLDDSEAKSNGTYLYEGQSVTELELFNGLDTFVLDENWTAHGWTTEHYGQDKYIKIAGVSFDGGTNWISQYPVTIPRGLKDNQMVIRIAYRLHLADKNWSRTDVTYKPAESRVYILSKKLTQNFQTIDLNTIVNKKGQYPAPGSTLNLYQYQAALLGAEETELTELFPGWTENGHLSGWFYSVKNGRHILEPAETVSVPGQYVVKVKMQELPEDYLPGKTQCLLQTLTAYTEDEEALEVPEYIQAVDPEDMLPVNTLKLPASVMVVNTEENLIVGNKYIVDANNPYLYAGEDGILYNKALNKILGIPYHTDELIVSTDINEVRIPLYNELDRIQIETTDPNEIPDMNLENTEKCEFTIDKRILKDFVEKYKQKLVGHELCVPGTDGSKVTYLLQNGTVADTNGNLEYVLSDAPDTLRLPENVNCIKRQAFAATNTSNIVLAQKETTLKLERGCFEGSKIKSIWCRDEKQKTEIESMLTSIGIDSSAITVRVINEKEVTTKSGYRYIITEPEDIVQLLNIPEDITSFDGKVLADDGTELKITSIGDEAFKDHTALEWVILPENIKRIGREAFYGCTSLQGILMDSTDEFTIGDKAFDGCNALRFVAANAYSVKTEKDYQPIIRDECGDSVFFIPTERSEDEECIWNKYDNITHEGFAVWLGLKKYRIEDIGQNGKMLYGEDVNGDPFIALRSGKTVDQSVTLPDTTREIYNCAMYQTKSASGYYTINWKDLSVMAVDAFAFYDSDLSGEVTFGVDGCESYLLKNAFQSCRNITGVTMKGKIVILGESSFVDCSALTKVTLGEFQENFMTRASLHYAMFAGCTSLQKLVLTGSVPPRLTSPGLGMTFRLMGEEAEKETGKIQIPDGMLETYLEAWKYPIFGCRDDNDLDDVAWNEFFSGGIDSPEDIDNWKAAKIEEGQQIICNWFGVEYLINTNASEMSFSNHDLLFSNENGIITVSDGNAMTQPDSIGDKAGNSEEEADDGERTGNTQEETVQ